MAEVLGFEPSENVHPNFKKLHDIIFASGKNYTLTEANKIFSQKGKSKCNLKQIGRKQQKNLLLFILCSV